MANPSADQPTAERRAAMRLVFQFAGATDIVLGAAIALFGPGFVGGEPLVDKVLVIAGAGLALGGLAMIWFARRRFAEPLGEAGTDSVFKVSG
jgi:hypothetical protein